MHPRLAHMALRAWSLGLAGLACEVAALIEERDILKAQRGSRDADLRLRIETLRTGESFAPHHGLVVDRGALSRVRQAARDWRRRLGLKAGEQDGRPGDAGILVAFAYPDRIARRRPGDCGRYAMAGGGGAFFPDPEPLSAEDWLAVAEVDGDKREARVFLAAPLAKAEIDEHFADDIVSTATVAWNGREEAVLARRQRKLWQVVLDDQPLTDADPAALAAAMAAGVRAMGLGCLPWTDELQTFRHRVAFLRGQGDGWPDLSDQALLDGLEDWLVPYLSGITRRSHLARLDLAAALTGMLEWEAKRRLDELAPTHVTVPSGSRVRIDYSGEAPVLAVRLQEMFGCADTPRIAAGRVPLLLHLLSPARRPVQVTRDLASFWANAYKAVKADLKGQYPKHWWPDDPMQAEPTARAKPRGR
jgi:ATP-dependent helicase HrpB